MVAIVEQALLDRDSPNLRSRAYDSFTRHLLARDLRAGQFISQRELVEMTQLPLAAIREMFERFFAAAYALYLHLLAALMNILLIARHTRAEEQSGRSEVLRANVVGRHAPLTAALIVAGIANAAATLIVIGLAIANGYATEGSALVGVTMGLTGMAWAGITAVTVQLSANSRAAAARSSSRRPTPPPGSM